MFDRFPIIDGESVSHWLARITAKTGINPTQLAESLGIPIEQQPTPPTIARLEERLLETRHLGLRTHIPVAEYPAHIQQTLTTFVPKLGPRGHITGGASYCPRCLSEGLPFMARWQNTLVTVCTKHWTPMQSHCPECNAFVSYILSFKRYGRSTACHQCEAELNAKFPAIDLQESNLQRLLIECLNGTIAPLAGSTNVNYIRGLVTIIEYLRRHFSQLALEGIATELNLPNQYGGYTRQQEFNKQSLVWRRMIINLGIWFSLDWPRRFEQIAGKFSLNVSHAKKPNPEW